MGVHETECEYAQSEAGVGVTAEQAEPAPPEPPAPEAPKTSKPDKRGRVRDFAAEHARRKAKKAAQPPVAAASGGLNQQQLAQLAESASGAPPAPGTPGTPAPSAAPEAKKRGRRSRAEVDADLARVEAENARLKTQAQGPKFTVEQCAAMLDGNLKVFGDMAARMTGVPEAAPTDDERKMLVDLWSPFLPQVLAEHGDKAPIAMAVIGTVGTLYRPVMAVVIAKKARNEKGPVTVETISAPVSR